MRDSGVPSEVLVRSVSFMIQHVGRMNLATCHAFFGESIHLATLHNKGWENTFPDEFDAPCKNGVFFGRLST